MLSIIYALCQLCKRAHYAECHYAECCYADCRYAECRGTLLSSFYFIFSHFTAELGNSSNIVDLIWLSTFLKKQMKFHGTKL